MDRGQAGRASEASASVAVMQIRPAVADDAPRIARVWESAWRDGHVGHIPDELLVYRQSDSFDTRTAAMIEQTWVAEVDGGIVGFVTLKDDELEQLMVDAAARGTGVAIALLGFGAQRLLDAGHAHPWLAVVTGNARARHFYEREGWRDAGHLDYEAPIDGGTVTVSCRRYELIRPRESESRASWLTGSMTRIGTSFLDVHPLSLGGNVFGWTADRDASFAILDAFAAGGGDFIDTADSYSAWVPGNIGGDSERIIGEWLASRRPERVVVATKVSQHPDFKGLSAKNVRAAAEASLARLGVDAIDLYFAHFDDESVPLEETVGAFGQLVRDGLVRYTAVSNYSAERIREWIRIADATGVARPVAIQPHYNLVHRHDVEADIIPLAQEFELSLVPYFSLAKGFLTGKYRSTDASGERSPRAAGASTYATEHGLAIIDTLDRIGQAHGISIAASAIAWLRAQPTVAAPIASASRVEQVADLLDGARTDLTADEIAELSAVSEWSPVAA